MITINEQYFAEILAKRLSQKSNLVESAILVMTKQAIEETQELSNDVSELYDNLKERIVHFYYKKTDGSTREAWGTLNPFMLANFETSGSKGATCKRNRGAWPGCVTYFDVERKEFRSFKVANFLYLC